MKRKTRVLQVVPSLRPGGAERMMMHLLLGLNRSRYSVAAVSLGARHSSDLEQIADDAGVDMYYLGKRRGFDLRIFPKFDRILREFRPDVVHLHLNALLYAAPPSLMRGVPAIVYTAHNYPDLLVPRPLRSFYRTCFHCGITLVSIARSLVLPLQIEFKIDRLPLIPNGIPVDQFRYPGMSRLSWRRRAGFLDHDFLFLSVARLSPQKNHELMLRAFAADPKMRVQAHLLLAGDGELRDPLERLAQELDIDARVHFLGNRTDIAEMMGACDAFVLSSWQEGNPLCVMEAMAAGLPVISTAVGGVPELIWPGIHGLLTEPGSVESFAHAMSTMMRDTEFREECALRSAQRAARKFDVQGMIDGYDSLYRHLLTAGPKHVYEGKQCLTQSESLT